MPCLDNASMRMVRDTAASETTGQFPHMFHISCQTSYIRKLANLCLTIVVLLEIFKGKVVMARNRHSDGDILKLLCEIELKLGNGSDVQSACRSVGVSDATYYNWRKRFGAHCQTK